MTCLLEATCNLHLVHARPMNVLLQVHSHPLTISVLEVLV